MDDGVNTGEGRGEDGQTAASAPDSDGWQDLSAELQDFFGGSVQADAEFAFLLLDGRRFRGPFHRMGARGPYIDVYETEIIARSGGLQGRKGGWVGRVDHDADEEDLLERFGPGVWICRVRRPDGTYHGQKWVGVGTKTQRRAALEARERERRPGTTEEPAAPSWMQELLAQQREEAARRDALQRQEAERRAQQVREDAARRDAELRDLRAQLDQQRIEAERRREAELSALRDEITRQRSTPAPEAPDLVGAYRKKAAELRALQEVAEEISPTPPEPEPDAMDEFIGLLGSGQKLKQAAGMVEAMLDDDDAVADLLKDIAG